MATPTTPVNSRDSVTDVLEADHRRLDDLLSRTREKVAAGDLKGAAGSFSPFHDGLLRHIRIEEDLVFPDFEAATGTGASGPTVVMRREHAEIQNLLTRLKALLDSAAPAPPEFERLATALVSVLSAHNLKEEHVLYPMTDRMVPPARLRVLLMRIRETP